MILRYPGSKGKLAKRLVKVILNFFESNRSKRITYIEPFFGAGAIGLRLLKETAIESIIFNDIDPGIYSIWKTIQEKPQDLIGRIEAFTPSVDAFYEFKSFLLDFRPFAMDADPQPPTGHELVDLAFKKIAIHQMSFSGLGTKSGGPLGGESQTSEYKVDCRWSPKQLKKEILRISSLMASKKTWDETHQRYWNNCHIFGCEFYHAWTNQQNPAFVYLDPPYYEKGPELYQFSFGKEQHEWLATRLRSLPHPWLLSYDDCEEIRALYDYAVVREVPLKYSINGATTKTELLIAPKGYEYLLNDVEDKKSFDMFDGQYEE